MKDLRNWLKLLIDKLQGSLNLPLRFYFFPHKRSFHSTEVVFGYFFDFFCDMGIRLNSFKDTNF
jgi:hypothetical protein